MSKNISSRKIYIIVAIIAVICLIVSIIIHYEKNQFLANQQSFCSILTGSNGCETVQTSNYSYIMGISNPIYGIIGFSLLAIFAVILAIKQIKVLRYSVIIGSFIAGMLAIWFLYVQTFVLKKFCIFCVVVDISSLILCAISIFLLTMNKKDSSYFKQYN